MKTVLLPVKDFDHAKQRLAGALEPGLRAGLARAMLTDVLVAISRASLPQRVIVFTASDAVVEVARHYPFEVMREEVVQGHSAAVNRMVDELRGAAGQILAIAGDLPTLTADDVDRVFELAGEQVNLVSSRDGTGTNAALFTLPSSIPMQYGEGSLKRHLASASAAGFKAQILRIPGIEFDLDTPEDLEFFLQTPQVDSETWRFVQAECVGWSR